VAPGDLLTLTVQARDGERGRTEAIVLSAADAGAGAPVGRGQVVFSPTALEDLTTGDLLRLTRPKMHLPKPGKMFVNVLDCPGSAAQTVHLVNYGFRYKVTIPGLYATDGGEQKARTPLTRPSVVVRKRLPIEKPAEVVDPVLPPPSARPTWWSP
jgi:hypothetical protein